MSAGTISTATTQTLNPLTLPLYGHRLIEASAGTGKTWTIAALYLRLLLGHGEQQSAHKQPLTVDQILVVTFTEAATEELRDRIRRRIHEAREAFLRGSAQEPFLQQLLQDSDHHAQQAERLLAAERQMDEAAIFTIHGFCQRMLKQHAFESGTLFTSELMEDQSELISDTVADFWRRTMYPLDLSLAELTRSIWSTPEQLEKTLLRWLNIHDLQLINTNIPTSLAEIKQQVAEIEEIKALWRSSQDEIQIQLAAVLKKNSKSFKRLEGMHKFAHSTQLEPIISNELSWFCYTPEVLAANCGKNKTPPDLKVFRRIEALCARDMNISEAFEAFILREALADVGQRLIQRRFEIRKMSFDDLLVQLDSALRKPGGDILADHIRTLFQVALIDEFQDTDAIQYRIFSHLYPIVLESNVSSNDGDEQEHGLFLIGDPKQAIYAFRGADIFTYIHAKHQIQAHYTLPINWRSSAAMIAATNHLFQQADSAFIYDDDIPFQPVNASINAAQRGLFIDDEPIAALQIWNKTGDDGGHIGKGAYETIMAAATANEINRLLTLAQAGRCQVGGSQRVPLTPDKVAVLVRTGYQAQRVKEALLEQNIASVYLSDRSSVFDSAEAIDISRLLAACLEPTNERRLRAALATQLLANDAATLDELNNDETQWELAIEEFSEYHNCWLSRGILPMLRLLVTRRKLAENLLTVPGGERRLTNILHLGELLATAAKEKETPHALLRWLQERTASPDTNAKDQQLHLESERKLVQIVTIHKSKGLEYDVVFIPFACTWTEAKHAIFHNDEQQVVADLLGRKENVALADRERLAEDLRLLYVALTRSVHACYLGVGPVREYKASKQPQATDLEKSALGHLLVPNREITVNDFLSALQQLADDCHAIALTELPYANGLKQAPYQPEAQKQERLTARQFTGFIANNWWLTSYSALSRHASHAQAPDSAEMATPDASAELPGLDIEVYDQQQTPSAIERPAYSSLLDFPKGAQPGTFLHAIFEHIAFEDPDPAIMATMISEQLLIHGFEAEWHPVLTMMVNDTINAPLNDNGLTLSALKVGDYRAELEFNLPLGLLKAHPLNNLLRQYDPLSKQAGDLIFQNVQGMLKGFIDLTFTHKGLWYVLDWKSNWLGDTTAAYTQEAMAKGMIDHRYDLQYLIYVLALHRMLKSRLPEYDYDTHMGGAFYIFLRGIQPPNTLETLTEPKDDLATTGDLFTGETQPHEQTGIYHHRPQRELIEALDRLFQGEAKESSPC